MDSMDNMPALLALPAELILQIFSYLPATSLALVSATCRSLQRHAYSDHLWQAHINYDVAEKLSSPHPLDSFRELYVAHHPYWFLPRHRIWISDAEPSGKLLVARYNPYQGCIEAYTVAAERGMHTYELWSHDRNVAIHSFNPRVKLHLEQPVVKLNIGSPRRDAPSKSPRRTSNGLFSTGAQNNGDTKSTTPSLSKEILMECSNSPGLKTSFMLSRDHPAELTEPNSAVWPPLNLPAPSRTRNISPSGDFTSLGHRPTKLSEVSQNTFRLRKWVDFHGRRPSTSISIMPGIDRLAAAAGLGFVSHGTTLGTNIDRRGEQVSTFGTLSPESYTPTPSKPWRGIYCGDYSGHGCEFLVVLQPDAGTEDPMPEGTAWLQEWLEQGTRSSNVAQESVYTRGYAGLGEILANLNNQEAADFMRDVQQEARAMGLERGALPVEAEGDDEDDSEDDGLDLTPPEPGDIGVQSAAALDGARKTLDKDVYSGSLVAIKLTGDPNIPRGKITFLAPDLGDKGLVRTAQEEIFRGARVVKSAGHVAARGYRDAEYIPSQLVLLSHDRLAQYWEGFGHISFYQRVDIDALMKQR